MVIKISVVFYGHDPIVSFRMERKDAFFWALEHAADIDGLEVDAGLNVWSWSRASGWIQFPQVEYTPGLGVHYRKLVRPIHHGNGYNANHPWRFCMPGKELTPNPFCAFNDLPPF